jgi:hypothetical protein
MDLLCMITLGKLIYIIFELVFKPMFNFRFTLAAAQQSISYQHKKAFHVGTRTQS